MDRRRLTPGSRQYLDAVSAKTLGEVNSIPMGHEVCFLCGLPGPNSDEHVVPRCFYIDGRPPSGITARANSKR